MKLEDYKAVFSIVGFAGILLFASPNLGSVLHPPSGESFSELWILGPRHMLEGYPSNITTNKTYSVYVGVSNHIGSMAYYAIHVKFRNESELLPNISTGLPSPLSTLFEYQAIVPEERTWEETLTFSFSEVSGSGDQCMIRTLNINNNTFVVDKLASWDSNRTGYYYQIFLELWIYDNESRGFQFHNRFVSLWLNMTIPQ